MRTPIESEFEDLLAQIDEADGGAASLSNIPAVEAEEMEQELRLSGSIGGIALALRAAFEMGGGIHEID